MESSPSDTLTVATNNTINKNKEFEEFCKVLFGAEYKSANISLRCIPERADLKARTSAPVKLHIGNASISSVVQRATELNALGYAIYYLPQEFKAGQYDECYKDLVSIRAVVVDCDKGLSPASYPVPPTAIVNTSLGKYQIIWKFSPKIPVLVSTPKLIGEFNDLIAALAYLLGGDGNACKATQCFRVPGFRHWKEGSGPTGYESHIHEMKGGSVSFDAFCQSVRLRLDALEGSSGAGKGKKGKKGKGSSLQGFRESHSIDLSALIRGEVRVGKGERHGTILGLAMRFWGQDLKEPQVTAECLKVIRESFEGGAEFLPGGGRFTEATKCIEDGARYVKDKRDMEEFLTLKALENFNNENNENLGGIRSGSTGNGKTGGTHNSDKVPGVQSTAHVGIHGQPTIRLTSQTENSAVLHNSNGASTREPQNGEGSEGGGSEGLKTRGALEVSPYSETALVERTLETYKKRLARLAGRAFCYNEAQSLWVPQNADGSGELSECIKAIICKAVEEDSFTRQFVVAKGDDKEGKKVNKGAVLRAKQSLLKAGAVGSMTKALRSHSNLPVYDYKDFDAQGHLLYCANGLVNMKTGELRKASAEDRLLCQSTVTYIPGEPCDGWMEFLGEVFRDNEEPEAMIKFIQCLFGYSLSGSIAEEKVFCHVGGGANGKSKLLSALSMISGNYRTIIAADELATKKGGFTKSLERMGSKIEGRRIAIVDDFESNATWNESFLKTLTGMDARAEEKYEKSRVICNKATWHIGMNEQPKSESENNGILRRLCPIPYPRTFNANSSDETRLRRMIEVEASGILNFAIEGFRLWVTKKMVYPRETILALEEYKQEHFKVNTAIHAIFEAPPIEQIEEGNGAKWETLEALNQDLDREFERQGLGRSGVSPEKLGKLLKTAFNLKQKKIWLKEKDNAVRHYLVKLKFDRKTPFNTL